MVLREFARRCIPGLLTMDDLSAHPAETFYRVRYGNATLTQSEAAEINAMLVRLETMATARAVTL